jgi:hypothetical protein
METGVAARRVVADDASPRPEVTEDAVDAAIAPRPPRSGRQAGRGVPGRSRPAVALLGRGLQCGRQWWPAGEQPRLATRRVASPQPPVFALDSGRRQGQRGAHAHPGAHAPSAPRPQRRGLAGAPGGRQGLGGGQETTACRRGVERGGLGWRTPGEDRGSGCLRPSAAPDGQPGQALPHPERGMPGRGDGPLAREIGQDLRGGHRAEVPSAPRAATDASHVRCSAVAPPERRCARHVALAALAALHQSPPTSSAATARRPTRSTFAYTRVASVRRCPR